MLFYCPSINYGHIILSLPFRHMVGNTGVSSLEDHQKSEKISVFSKRLAQQVSCKWSEVFIDQAAEQLDRTWGGDSPGPVTQSHLSVCLACCTWMVLMCVPGCERSGGTAPKNEKRLCLPSQHSRRKTKANMSSGDSHLSAI